MEVAALSVHVDPCRLFSRVESYLTTGFPLEAIYLELLQPAARHLGDRWVDDTLDFATVTLGLCQMHRVVREYSSAFQTQKASQRNGRHALLAPAGNEHHCFGLTLVGEFLRREGWVVSFGPFASSNELRDLVESQWLTLAGFSLSCDSGLNALAAQIKCVRKASRNRDIRVIVGGRVFVENPEYVARIGADAMADDARQATALSRRLAEASGERRR
jgi:methanogenic corrinoid protein MtbC1